MEDIASEQGFELDEVSTERLNELWGVVKAKERGGQ